MEEGVNFKSLLREALEATETAKKNNGPQGKQSSQIALVYAVLAVAFALKEMGERVEELGSQVDELLGKTV